MCCRARVEDQLRADFRSASKALESALSEVDRFASQTSSPLEFDPSIRMPEDALYEFAKHRGASGNRAKKHQMSI